MSRRNAWLSVAAVVGVAFFFGALVHLILLRYQRGDLYPASSSLRADPLGTRALYEALSAAGGHEVDRGLVPLRRELAEKPAAYLLLGLDARHLSEFVPEETDELSDYVRKGGRVVITLASGDPGAESESDEDARNAKKSGAKKENDKIPLPPIPEPPGQPKTAQEKYERGEYLKDQKIVQRLDPDRYVPEKFEPSLPAVWVSAGTSAARKKRAQRAANRRTKKAPQPNGSWPIPATATCSLSAPPPFPRRTRCRGNRLSPSRVSNRRGK